jgi:hypothetical protein
MTPIVTGEPVSFVVVVVVVVLALFDDDPQATAVLATASAIASKVPFLCQACTLVSPRTGLWFV